MTNNLAVIKLSAYRSDIGFVSLQADDLSIHLEIAEGLDGGIARRGEDDFVPFRAGRRRTQRWPDARPIVLNGYVMDTEASPLVGYRTAMDRLLAIFCESSEALLLIATLEDGSVRWVETWHPNIVAPATEDGAPGIKRVSIEVSGDPYWLGPNGYLLADDGHIADDGLFADSSGPVIVSPGSGSVLVPLSPLGTADVMAIRVTLTGPSASPVGVSARPSGIGVEMASALVAGDVLVIDSAVPSVTLNGSTARNGMTLNAANEHGEYLRLPKGSTGLVVTGQPAGVTIEYDATYL